MALSGMNWNGEATIDLMKTKNLKVLLAAVLALVLTPSTQAALVTLQQPTASASYSQSGFGVAQAVDGITTSTFPSWNGWAIDPNETRQQTAVFETTSDTDFLAAGGFASIKLIQDFTHANGDQNHQIGRFQLSYTTADRSSFADGLSSGGLLGSGIWTVLDPSAYQAYYRNGTLNLGTTLTELGDNSILAGGSNNRGYYVITAPLAISGVTGFRIDVLPDASLPHNGPGREPSNGNFVLTEFQVSAVPEPTTIIAGALLLLPFGASTIRFLRKNRTA